MILVAEIAMLIGGFIALVSGRFKLTKNRTVVGGAARWAGFIMLLPLPIGFSVGFVIGFQEAAQGRVFSVQEWAGRLAVVEGLLIVGCLLLSFLIAACGTTEEELQRPSATYDSYAPPRQPVEELPYFLPGTTESPPVAEPYQGPLPAILPEAISERTEPAPAIPLPGRALGGAPPVTLVPSPRRRSAAPWVGLGLIAVVACAGIGGLATLVWEPSVASSGPMVRRPAGSALRPALPIDRETPPNQPKQPQRPAGELLRYATPHPVRVGAMAPDGSNLAVVDADNVMRLYDLETLEPSATPLPGNERIEFLAYSPTGRYLASAGGSLVVFRKGPTGQAIRPLEIGFDKSVVTAMAFSPDETLAAALGDRLRLWNVSSGQSRDFLLPSNGQRYAFTSLHFTPDGRQLFAGGTCTNDGKVERADILWDVVSGKPTFLNILPKETAARAMLSRDGQRLVLEDRTQRLHVVDLSRPDEAFTLRGASPVTAIGFGPDDLTLAVAHRNGMVRFWDLTTKQEKGKFQVVAESGDSAVHGVWFTPDGEKLATAANHGLRLWDLKHILGRPLAVVERRRVDPIAPGAADIVVRELATLRAHPRDIVSLTISPDSTTLVTASGPLPNTTTAGAIKVWDLATHREKQSFSGTGPVAFTSNGAALLCVRDTKEGLRIWNIADGDVGPAQMECRLDGPGQGAFSMSLDGRLVLIGAQTKVRLCALPTLGALRVYRPAQLPAAALALAPDGTTFATAPMDGVSVITIADAKNGETTVQCKGHDQVVHCLTYSPDGKQLASTGADKTVKVWEVATGALVRTLDLDAVGVQVAFGPDGKLLAVLTGEGRVHLWGDVRRILDRAPGPRTARCTMAFAPNGKVLAVGTGGSVRLWDVSQLTGPRPETMNAKSIALTPLPEEIPEPQPKPLPEAAPPADPRQVLVRPQSSYPVGVNSFVHQLRFAPDGTLVLVGDTGLLRRWDPATGKNVADPIQPHKGSVISLSVSGDGKWIATGAIDGKARVYDARTGQETSVFAHGRIVRVALAPDAKQLAAAGGATDGIKLLDMTNDKELGVLRGHKGIVDALVYSADGKTLATGGTDKVVRLWNVAEQKEVAALTGHSGPIMSLAFAADGKMLASASSDGTIMLWDLATGKELRTLKGHVDPLSAVDFSPDGKRLVSGAGAIRFNPGNLGEVKLWDVATGIELATLKGHTRGVSSVAFAPDGKTAASASRDNTVKIWNVADVPAPRAEPTP